ncbi:20006_t:CDS:2, partial [Dentiscutata erythropus]
VVFGAFSVVLGALLVVFGRFPVVCGALPVVFGALPVVCGTFPVVFGALPVRKVNHVSSQQELEETGDKFRKM